MWNLVVTSAVFWLSSFGFCFWTLDFLGWSASGHWILVSYFCEVRLKHVCLISFGKSLTFVVIGLVSWT